MGQVPLELLEKQNVQAKEVYRQNLWEYTFS